MIVALVRFTPSARTNWHSRAVGQTLHVTDGIGLVVTRDGTVIRMRPGDTVYTPPGEEHWHGATADNFMCHLAMLEGTADGDGTTWLEPVTDEQYREASQQWANEPHRGKPADAKGQRRRWGTGGMASMPGMSAGSTFQSSGKAAGSVAVGPSVER